MDKNKVNYNKNLIRAKNAINFFDDKKNSDETVNRLRYKFIEIVAEMEEDLKKIGFYSSKEVLNGFKI